MLIRKLMAVPLLAFALAGCIKEDRSQCPEHENVTFLFSYGGDRGSEFTDRIAGIDLFLFDGEGKYLFSRSAETSGLEPENPSMSVALDPGTYYALAWANVSDNSVYQNIIPGETSMEECLVEIDPASTRTGDPIYYAPRKALQDTRSDVSIYEVVVPPNEDVVKPLDFVRAHRTIYVWIRGFQDTDNLHPTVEAAGLWSRYDFSYRTHDHRRDFVQQAAEHELGGTAYVLAVFHHAYGAIDDDMNVSVLRTSDGETTHTVSVRQFIEDNLITDTDDIHILLTFSYDFGVAVTLPHWAATSVEPGVD